ncbi:MAG: hypothetical protein ACKODS_05580, partial [Methylophilaceae bacterium]
MNIAFLFTSGVVESIAQIPRTLTVQGVLMRTDFNDGFNSVITTTLYTLGPDSLRLFSQTDTLHIKRDGLFTVVLGKDQGLPPYLTFDRQYVVEFTVNGSIMPMRIPLQSVPYAFTSEKVSDNSVELRHLSQGLKQKLQFQEEPKSGKGENMLANYVNGLRSVIAGGDENRTSSNYASITGGFSNSVSAPFGSIGGGQANMVQGNYGFVGGGSENRAQGSWSTVTAGNANIVTSSSMYGTVSGGQTNQVGGNHGTIGGGRSNFVTSQAGTVSGGQENRAMQTFATVSGGQNNISSGMHSTIGGGSGNTSSGQVAAIAGGMNNKANGQFSVVSGGANNESYGNHAVVSGGLNNDANGEYSNISGGQDNVVSSNARHSFIAGGSTNKINSGNTSGIMGSNNSLTTSNNGYIIGTNNTVSSSSNGMAIGFNNQVSGQNATAIGTGHIASGNHEFVVGSFASNSTNPANTSNTAFTGNRRFSVGIGSSSSQRKNAITIFENGNTLFQGKVLATDTAILQNATIVQNLKIAGKIEVQQQLTVADDFTLGSENRAGSIKLIDQSGNWYTGFTTGTQSQNILYRLPTSPPLGGQVLASGSVNPLNLEWTYPGSNSETDPQVGTIATSGIPRWNGTALVTGSLTDDGTNVSTSGTFTSSNLTGTNTGDITIGTASGLSLSGQALSLTTATTTAAGAMSSSDKTKLNSIATGAEVNVNADWNAITGDAEILNKPTLGTMSAETASDYYTKTQTDAGFQVKDADLTTVATIGTNNQLLKVKNDGSGLEWFTPTYISSYTETDPQVGTIASSGVPRWNGTALVTGSLTDDGTNVSTSGTFTSSNLSGTNTGDITIGT